jgi:putative membrane protein insertion efficiency factor
VIELIGRAAWAVGWPVRSALLVLIGAYRITVGQVLGGNCRFHPTCSAYAELAVREVGAVRGTALSVWRLLRCSPLSSGGVDYPPRRSGTRQYDGVILGRPQDGGRLPRRDGVVP